VLFHPIPPLRTELIHVRHILPSIHRFHCNFLRGSKRRDGGGWGLGGGGFIFGITLQKLSRDRSATSMLCCCPHARKQPQGEEAGVGSLGVIPSSVMSELENGQMFSWPRGSFISTQPLKISQRILSNTLSRDGN
jgi:hypothetical protein